ncbi:MAG: TonB family protein [Thermodesulfobacteriota bacterium]|nr:TonB family protein [Thermodesulfobacteriota bacterium]
MHKLRLWTAAFFASILLNFMFFSLMPLMVNKNPSFSDKPKVFKTINVVRIKQKEIPPDQKKKKIEKKEEQIKKKTLTQQSRTVQKHEIKPLTKFPFEINQKLPPVPGMPAINMQDIKIDVPALKNAYMASEIDNSLTPLAHVPPLYPFRAKRRGIEGWVKVKFLVNKNGAVEKIKIVEAEPKDIFNKSVLNTIPQWRFSPGTVEGIVVNTWVVTTIRFKLEN